MTNGKRLLRAQIVFGVLIAPLVFFSCKGGGSGNGSSSSGDFANQPEKVSYAFGVNVGSSLNKMMEKRGIDKDSIDPEIIAQGIIDQMKEGTDSRVHKDSVSNIVRSYFQKVRERKRKANQQEGQAFIQKERKKEGVQQTQSGLTYEVLKEGSGTKPDKWDSVKVHYEGTKIDGETFDSTMAPSKPAKFSVQGQVVQGWTEALQMMKEGSEWKLILPPKLAYGRRGRGQKIGPSETLVFNIQLKEVIEVDSADAAKKQGQGRSLSPAMKRRLQRRMQQRRGR